VRVFCYAQHLSGVGHFVRTHALACGLAEAHEVLLVDGGVPVPRLPDPVGLTRVALPRIQREGSAVVPLCGDRPLAEVMGERVRRLTAAASRPPPDVMTIEHYPWSKWELEDEIRVTIGAARRLRPGVRVVCSLRDVSPRTRHEAVGEAEYERRVLERLAAHFDALLIHADPRFTRLEEHFGSVARLPIPWAYTGFVTAEAVDAGAGESAPYAVLSAGGGARALPFLLAACEAFHRLSSHGELGAMRLVVFAGLSMDAAARDALATATRGRLAAVLPFSPDFPGWLRRSQLSISQAGYNTCADLLAARIPAVLVPHAGMSDQRFRAERMQAHELATVAPGDPPDVDVLVEAIRKARAAPRPVHDFSLRGVAETRTLLEGLHRTRTLAGAS
jgi:predicted glycosyltransferase